MTSPHGSALKSVGLALVLVGSLGAAAVAQRQQVPGPDTRKVLVTTFHGDVQAAIEAGEEIRNRIQGEFSVKTLMPITRKDMNVNLENGGFKADSALSPTDTKELARVLRADEVIDGVVAKTATGYRVEARMFLSRDISLSQPLGTFEAKDFGGIARQVVDEYDRARKQIPDNQACENGIRSNAPAAAISAARKGIQNYDKATLTRLCLATAFAAMKGTADSTGPWKDSVIAVTTVIIKLDPVSRLAYELAFEAYKAKSDSTNALRILVELMKAEPGNAQLRDRVIAELVNYGRPKEAVPIIRQALVENPGDPALMKTLWQVLRTARMFKESVPAGEEWVKLDTANADSSYFLRQVSDAGQDSAFAKAAQFATLAHAKYPRNVDFLLLKAQNERKGGQLPAAKASLEQVLQLAPTTPLAAAQLATIDADLGQVDEAMKVLKADAATDASNKPRDAALALSFGKKLYDAAAASKSRADYLKALPVLQASDEIAASDNASFFISVSAFQALAGDPETLKTMKTCDDFKAASELLTLVSIHMPRGGKVSPETARQVLGYVPQIQTFLDASVKKSCK